MELSIVIPAYNEAHKIARDVQAAGQFLLDQQLAGEIIVADDGSSDGTAQTARNTPVPAGIELKVLDLPHAGKGSAVRQGILESVGQYVMFADAGLCIPYDDVLPGLEQLRAGECEIANGSRKLPASVIDRPQSTYRWLLSRFFRWTVLRFLNLPRELSDTQCGFKIYQGEVARELYSACRIDGFMFDLEVLMRARAKGYTIREFPVHWTCDRDSRLKPAKILFRTLAELHTVKRSIEAETPAEVVARP